MNKVMHQNTGTTPIYVGGVLIPPGSAREVPAYAVPAAAPEAASPKEDPVLILLDGNVKEVTEALPALSDADLDRVEVAETAGKTRKGVLEAIAADRIRRAQESPVDAAVLAFLEGTVEDIVSALAGLSDAHLAAVEDGERDGKDRKGVLEAVAAERESRAA